MPDFMFNIAHGFYGHNDTNFTFTRVFTLLQEYWALFILAQNANAAQTHLFITGTQSVNAGLT